MILWIRILIILAIFASTLESTSYAENQDKKIQESVVNLYDFILSYECKWWPSEKSLTAYWDHKGYSIGCGTPSYKGERITREEAMRRFYEYTEIRVKLVKKHFPNISWNKLTALVSLASNNGTCYNIFRKWQLTEYLWREKCDNVKKDWKLVELRGLHLRRNAEADLYFWKNIK
jgi:hypothetical protein